MSAIANEMKLLRRELEKVWILVSVIMDAWAQQTAMFVKEIKRLAEERDSIKKRCEDLEAVNKDLERRLAIHENYNNPDRSTLTAKSRKKHRKALQEKEAESAKDTGEDASKDADSILKKRGGQPGSKGTSFEIKPDKSLMDVQAANMCAVCRRTDVIPLTPIWKIILEMYKSGGMFCYMEVSIPVICLLCKVITYPVTKSIPGTSCGPLIREKIMNIHEVQPSERKIMKLMKSNHTVILSEGAISNCLAAISKHAEHGVLWVDAPTDIISAATETMTAYSEPPVESLQSTETVVEVVDTDTGTVGSDDADAAAAAATTTLPVPYSPHSPHTRQQSETPPLITQIIEKISMEPYVAEDESRVKVAGSQEVALALQSRSAALICITDDKSKSTIRSMFSMALNLPLLADMYLAGNAFYGDICTCYVHWWRKSESLAVIHGIDSPEQTYSAMLLDICMRARDTAARITTLAGGPLTSICEVGRATRSIPGLPQMIDHEIGLLDNDIEKMIHAYRYGEVSDEESRKYANTLENALPFMFTFLRHPGMPGNTNRCELLIKRRVVLPRKIQVALPNWTAAKNQANLQTIHENAAIWGTFSGKIVSGSRGSWKPPPTKTNMLMAPPPQRYRPYARPIDTSDPAIQADPIRVQEDVKVAAA